MNKNINYIEKALCLFIIRNNYLLRSLLLGYSRLLHFIKGPDDSQHVKFRLDAQNLEFQQIAQTDSASKRGTDPRRIIFAPFQRPRQLRSLDGGVEEAEQEEIDLFGALFDYWADDTTTRTGTEGKPAYTDPDVKLRVFGDDCSRGHRQQGRPNRRRIARRRGNSLIAWCRCQLHSRIKKRYPLDIRVILQKHRIELLHDACTHVLAVLRVDVKEMQAGHFLVQVAWCAGVVAWGGGGGYGEGWGYSAGVAAEGVANGHWCPFHSLFDFLQPGSGRQYKTRLNSTVH